MKFELRKASIYCQQSFPGIQRYFYPHFVLIASILLTNKTIIYLFLNSKEVIRMAITISFPSNSGEPARLKAAGYTQTLPDDIHQFAIITKFKVLYSAVGNSRLC